MTPGVIKLMILGLKQTVKYIAIPTPSGHTSRVQVAFPRLHRRVLAGQPLVGPAEALCREEHPVTQAGELGEQLLRTRRKDDIITEGKQITHTVNELPE